LEFRDFSFHLAEWYKKNKRELPWRKNTDPYTVWLSEIILQQTRVNQGMPYFMRFKERFKRVCDLANAPETEVMRLWQGLGYYSRAKNLHKCAREVCHVYGGQFPDHYEGLLTLPGVGPYTAAAIASISFNKNRAVVDGNVIRVVSRFFGIQSDISERATQTVINDLAHKLLPRQDPGTHNQALMELGALVCVPKNPNCPACPIQSNCEANAKQIQDVLPVEAKKIKKRKRFFFYWVLHKGNNLALWERTGRDIWNGLYQFYKIETDRASGPEYPTDGFIDRLIGLGGIIGQVDEWPKHILTHQEIHAVFVQFDLNAVGASDVADIPFYNPEEVEALPKPILLNRYLHEKFI